MTSRSASPLFTPRKLAALLAVCAAGIAPGIAFAQDGAPKDGGLKDNGSYGPIVAIVSPEYSDVLKGEAKITIAVKPRRYPVQGVELLVDGKAVTGVLDPQTKFSWKTWLFVDGPHTLGVRVTDTQGFIGQAETTVYINNERKADATAPILRWTGVKNGQNLSGRANVRVEAGDNFGVKFVMFSLNPAITPDIKPVLTSWFISQPPYEVSLDTTRYKDGMYVLDALAFDASDNERSAQRLTVGFFNGAAAPATPEEIPVPEKPDSNKTSDIVAPVIKDTPHIAPPRPAATPRVVTPPQVTVTEGGFISNTPAPTVSPAPQSTTPRATINATAKISQPTLPTRVAPEIVEATTPTRIAERPVNKAAQAPSVSVAGQSNSISTIANPTKSLDKQRLAVAPEIRWTTPNEFRKNTNSGSNASTTVSSQQTAPQSTPSLPSPNIAPLTNNAHAPQLTTPQTKPTYSGAQLTQSTLDIGPNTRIASIEPTRQREARSVNTLIAELPQAASVQTTKVSAKVETNSARTTSVAKVQTPRPAVIAPQNATRIAGAGSTPGMPTAPRVAFSPNMNKANKPVLSNAAIIVSPTTDAPIVHVAQNNETLDAIAKKYKMPVSAIAAANDLKANAKVAKGAKVLLPQTLLVSYQGQAVTGDVAPVLIGSTSVAPFRFLFEKQGGTLDWDATLQRITARNANHEVSLEIGSDIAVVNKKEVMMDMAAFLLSGRTMVPVRFFEKALQAKVEWEPSTGRIFIAMTP